MFYSRNKYFGMFLVIVVFQQLTLICVPAIFLVVGLFLYSPCFILLLVVYSHSIVIFHILFGVIDLLTKSPKILIGDKFLIQMRL